MITKKQIKERFCTIDMEDGSMELMTSHTVYEDESDELYPEYSGGSTRGYLGVVSFDGKVCHHRYMSIIDGNDVDTVCGSMDELCAAIKRFVDHVRSFHVNTDYASPLTFAAYRLESVAHQYLRHLGFEHCFTGTLSDSSYGIGGFKDENGRLDAASCIMRVSCSMVYDRRDEMYLPITIHKRGDTFIHVECNSLLDVLKSLHSLVFAHMIMSNASVFEFLNSHKEDNEYILGKVENAATKYDVSDFFNMKKSDYKKEMIENLEKLLKQLKED